MKDSTRRSLRSGYHGLLTVIALIPLIAIHVPAAGVLASALGILMLVSKGLNALEEANLIPSWLKGDTTVTAPPADLAPEPESTGHANEVPAPSTPAAPEGDAAP